MRLDKLLAHMNYGSRKEVKELIRKGYVLVNGEVVYNDDKTYTYTANLTLTNRQKIDVQYPESLMLSSSGAELKFVEGFESDALYLSEEAQTNDYNIYSVKNKKPDTICIPSICIAYCGSSRHILI